MARVRSGGEAPFTILMDYTLGMALWAREASGRPGAPETPVL